jgi:GMP synthase (glutamine-hydrolysing)
MKRVLLLKAGQTSAPMRLAFGDYDRWFEEALFTAGASCQLTIVPVWLGQTPPPADDFDAVVMSGSPLSVTAPEPWMWRSADYMLNAAHRGAGVLGVCFGHQLLAKALGAQVRKCPRGREIGTVNVSLSTAGQADGLFRGLSPSFAIQATHEDEVAQCPAGATVLAHNGHSAIQALAVGTHLRTVQFHPELSTAGMKATLRVRAPADAESPLRVRPSPAGPTILSNFLAEFGRRSR